MFEDRSMLGRVLTVLDACVDSDEPIPLSRLAVEIDLPKATTWRIAESLVSRGLLAHGTGGYRAGLGLVERGDRAARQATLRSFVVPELVELHRQTAAAVWAVDVSHPREWVVIAQVYDRVAVQNRYSDRWLHDPTRPAILATALGLVGLADRPEAVDDLLRRGVPMLTRNAQVEPTRILRMVRQGADQQQLIEHGQVWLGWSCLAVPVVDSVSHRTVCVLGVVDRTPRFVGPRVARAAHAAADRLQRQWNAQSTR